MASRRGSSGFVFEFFGGDGRFAFGVFVVEFFIELLFGEVCFFKCGIGELSACGFDARQEIRAIFGAIFDDAPVYQGVEEGAHEDAHDDAAYPEFQPEAEEFAGKFQPEGGIEEHDEPLRPGGDFGPAAIDEDGEVDLPGAILLGNDGSADQPVDVEKRDDGDGVAEPNGGDGDGFVGAKQVGQEHGGGDLEADGGGPGDEDGQGGAEGDLVRGVVDVEDAELDEIPEFVPRVSIRH